MKLLSLVLSVAVLITHSSVWASSLVVSEVTVTTKISKGRPIDAVHRISHRSVKNLYCYTRTISESAAPTTIRHIWKRDGKAFKEASMAVKAKQWRSYSTLPVGRISVGKWQVEVLDEDGKQLKTLEFVIN